MREIIITLIAVLQINSACLAAVIFDDSGVLDDFASLIEHPDFKSAHPCSLSSSYQQSVENFEVYCEDDGSFCSSILMTTEEVTNKSIFKCEKKYIQIQTSTGDVETYTESDFLMNNKSYLLQFLEEIDLRLGYRVKVFVKRMHKGKMTIGHLNGNRRKIEVQNIYGEIEFIGINYRAEFILSASPFLPAPIQIQRFRLNDDNFLRLTDYKL